MGWRGALRSIAAAQRAAERDEIRQQRQLERIAKAQAKHDALEQAVLAVQKYENHIQRLTSVHRECGQSWDWAQHVKAPMPSMTAFMNELLEKIGDRESHPLMGLLDVVATFVRDYEERNVEIPESSAADALRFMMDQHQLRQVDLAELFGSQSNVSEVLSGKREINARQARALGG